MSVVARMEDLSCFSRNAMATMLRMACTESKGRIRGDQLGELQYSKQEVINVGLYQHDSYVVVRVIRCILKAGPTKLWSLSDLEMFCNDIYELVMATVYKMYR